MAFPVTSVLDNFDRANGAVGASWSKIWSGDNDLYVASNQVANNGTVNAWSNGGWNAATVGPDCECYLTIATVPTNVFNLYIRMDVLNTAGGPDGYRLSYNGDGTFYIDRMDSGTATHLGTVISRSLSNGDAVGIEMVGSTFTFYYKASGGSWTSVTTRTDATHSAAGYIGLEVQSTTIRGDNFGGGTIAAATRDQEGYRFRADDGSESAATWLANQDTVITQPISTNTRLRMLVNATGDPAAAQYQLEWRISGGTWRKVR